MCVNHLCVCASMHLRMYIFISTNKEGVGRDGSPEGFDSIGGTAEVTNHISTYKQGVGRDGSPEGFDMSYVSSGDHSYA